MNIELLPEEGLRLSEVSRDHFQLFLHLPLHADPSGCESAVDRLAQKPVDDPQNDEDDEINIDWSDHVLPDLQNEFAQQLDTVNLDLKAATQSESEDAEGPVFSFVIPFNHADHWFGALNQARLVMQERYRFPENETEETMTRFLTEETIKPYLIDQFYTQMQAMLLDLMLDPGA